MSKMETLLAEYTVKAWRCHFYNILPQLMFCFINMCSSENSAGAAEGEDAWRQIAAAEREKTHQPPLQRLQRKTQVQNLADMEPFNA